MNDLIEKAKQNWIWITLGALVVLSFFIAYEIIAAFGTAIIALFSGEKIAKNRMTSKVMRQTLKTEETIKEKELNIKKKVETARTQGKKEAEEWLDS